MNAENYLKQILKLWFKNKFVLEKKLSLSLKREIEKI